MPAVQLGARHCEEVLWKPFGGQVAVPLQVSWTSHTPADRRHTAPTLPAGWAQLPDWQLSVVQGFPSSVQSVPFCLPGCWQASFVPSHWSSVHSLPSSGQAV